MSVGVAVSGRSLFARARWARESTRIPADGYRWIFECFPLLAAMPRWQSRHSQHVAWSHIWPLLQNRPPRSRRRTRTAHSWGLFRRFPRQPRAQRSLARIGQTGFYGMSLILVGSDFHWKPNHWTETATTKASPVILLEVILVVATLFRFPMPFRSEPKSNSSWTGSLVCAANPFIGRTSLWTDTTWHRTGRQ